MTGQSPSDRNLRLTAEAIDAFNRDGADGLARFYAPDAEIFDPDRPGDGTFRGIAGLHAFVRAMTDGFDVVRVVAEQLIPAGDRVVGLLRVYGRSRDGTELEIRDGHIWTYGSEGLITYWRSYTHRDEALSDAGIAAGTTSAPG